MTVKYNYLITGGAGYLGSYLVSELLKRDMVKDHVIVFSRDELKHFHLRSAISDPRIKLVIGDIRDSDRIRQACEGVDVVIHAAAMKQLDSCEQNPEECIKTNVIGTELVIKAAKLEGVRHLIFISTDKAVEPVSAYGNSKQTAEKLVLRANGSDLRTYILRHGNLVGSTGSLTEKLSALPLGANFSIYHPDLTRFADNKVNVFTLLQAALDRNFSGCIAVPKLKAFRVVDLVRSQRPDLKLDVESGRPFEKTHEKLISTNELDRLIENEKCYLIPYDKISSDQALDRYRSLPSTLSDYDSSKVELMNLEEGKIKVSH